MNRLKWSLWLCLLGLSCVTHEEPPSDLNRSPRSARSQSLVTAAQWDATLGIPVCAQPGVTCDSNTLLAGRGLVGPEPHAPNTVGAECPDGDAGTFHASASVEAIRVSSLDGEEITAGRNVEVSVDIWTPADDYITLILLRATDASHPQWEVMDMYDPGTIQGGAHTFTTSFFVPEGPLQLVRAKLVRSDGARFEACQPGALHDHDDLAFSVAPGPPTRVVITSPTNGTWVTGEIPLTLDAYDASGVWDIEYLIDGEVVAYGDWATYEGSLYTPFTVSNGPHVLTARITNSLGGQTVSEPVNITVDNDTTSPEVVSVSPDHFHDFSGNVVLEANVTDDRGVVARVEFFIDDVWVGQATQAPFRVTWDSTTVANGPHSRSLRVYDPSGNSLHWIANFDTRN